MKKIIWLFIILIGCTISIEARKRPSEREVLEDHKKRVKPYVQELIRRKNMFPDGVIIKENKSKCYEFGREQNRKSIPVGSTVKMINVYNLRRVNFWQVIYQNKIYCIPNESIKPQEKIIVMEGYGRWGTEDFARYILLQNGTYIEVKDYIGPYGGENRDSLYPAIKGEYTRDEHKITLCMKEIWVQLIEGIENKLKNKECDILEKYNGQIPDGRNELKGRWINMKRQELVVKENIYE